MILYFNDRRCMNKGRTGLLRRKLLAMTRAPRHCDRERQRVGSNPDGLE